VGRWLEDFHRYSLVELDYGGLVQVLSDNALSSDHSAAEIAAAIDGVAKGERELALAMYQRARPAARARGIRDGELTMEPPRRMRRSRPGGCVPGAIPESDAIRR
jgi:hypothetical protein